MSSREVRFTAADTFQSGAAMRLTVNWPVKLGNSSRLTLEILGVVISSAVAATVVKIERYEFRTGGVTHRGAARRSGPASP